MAAKACACRCGCIYYTVEGKLLCDFCRRMRDARDAAHGETAFPRSLASRLPAALLRHEINVRFRDRRRRFRERTWEIQEEQRIENIRRAVPDKPTLEPGEVPRGFVRADRSPFERRGTDGD